MSDVVKFDLARDFSDAVGGRFKRSGPRSGESLRDDFLIPLLEQGKLIEINLSSALGIPPSFCEEAFGGLVRKLGASVIERISFAPETVCPERSALGVRRSSEAERFMREQAARDARDDIAPEYDFSKVVRGKYAKRANDDEVVTAEGSREG